MIGTEEAWALEELPADARRDRRRRVGRGDRLGLRPHGRRRCSSSRRSTACCRPRTPTSPRSPGARSPSRTSRSTPARSCENVQTGDSSVTFSYGDQQGEADWLVIAAGRGPDIEALGLEAAGVELDDRGLIDVDGRQRTSKAGRLRDRRPRPRPRARPQVLRRGHHRRRGRGGDGDPRARVRRHPARDVLRAQRRLVRPHRGAGARAGARRRRRQAPVRRGRRRHGLRRPLRASSRSSATRSTASSSAATSWAPRRST